MAKLTGQFTTPALDANNNKINKPFLRGVVFVFQGATKVTRESDDKGKYSFDLANGEYDVSIYLKGNTEKDRFDMRPGEKFVVTSTTTADALDKWLQVIGAGGKDELAAYYENLLAQMQAVYDKFQDETKTDGEGLFVKQSSVKKNSLRDAGSYHTQSNPENIDLWEAGRHGLMTNIVDNIPADVRELLRDSFMYVETQGIYSASLTNKWQFVFGYRRPEIVVRQYTPGAGGGWTSAKLLSTYNTTVDSNGNIKAASPVINLFANHIEPNNHFSQQYEKKPIFEKMGIGCYKISNTPGLAKGEYAGDWNVEVPKDINGERYFNTEWEQLEDNTVIIRTYEREAFTEEYQRYGEDGNALTDTQGNVLKFYKRHEINGKPIDIKAGRFIALRFLEDKEAKAKREAETEIEE